MNGPPQPSIVFGNVLLYIVSYCIYVFVSYLRVLPQGDHPYYRHFTYEVISCENRQNAGVFCLFYKHFVFRTFSVSFIALCIFCIHAYIFNQLSSIIFRLRVSLYFGLMHVYCLMDLAQAKSR